MPLYEYYCLTCDYRFEKYRDVERGDDPIKCPNCQCWSTQKIVSTPAVIFKGKGFYKTDNRKEK